MQNITHSPGAFSPDRPASSAVVKAVMLYCLVMDNLRKILVSPKDKTALEKQSGVIYSIKCKDCDSLYIGESGLKLEKRLAEHKSRVASSKSAISEHVECSKGHNIDWENEKCWKGNQKIFQGKFWKPSISGPWTKNWTETMGWN